jgi:predicted Zn-dependent protease with MMP-like domain
MNRNTFNGLVRKALQKIPRQFRDAMDNIEIVVEDWPDPDMMEEVTGDRDAILYGLFTGRPLPSRTAGDWGGLPSLIYLYRGPLEENFPDPEALAREIEITLVHEIAHYMGFNEDILREYGYG